MAKSLLYTKTGDKGTTSLVDGSRIAKNSVRLEAYGTLDEFSSFLGCVAANPDCPVDEKERVMKVQNMLFNFGGYLASPVKDGEQPQAWGLTEQSIEEIEHGIDLLDEKTPKIRAFVLPGGSQLAAAVHVARTVCRRAERRILALAEREYVDPRLISYINRLSDYLFILARYCNHVAGVEEVIWKKD
jgi:cob(I)alamin adenosyltransferase